MYRFFVNPHSNWFQNEILPVIKEILFICKTRSPLQFGSGVRVYGLSFTY